MQVTLQKILFAKFIKRILHHVINLLTYILCTYLYGMIAWNRNDYMYIYSFHIYTFFFLNIHVFTMQVKPAYKALLEMMGVMDEMDPLECLEPPVLLEPLGPQVHLGHREKMGYLVNQYVFLVIMPLPHSANSFTMPRFILFLQFCDHCLFVCTRHLMWT